MTATTPEEVYPPRGYILLGVHSDELFSTTIYPNRDEALAAARAVSDGWSPAVAPIGKGARTSWDEPPNPEPPKLIWVPDGGGFYARDGLNLGTYRVDRLKVTLSDPRTWWSWKYTTDGDGNWGGVSGSDLAPDGARAQAEGHNAALVRREAWATYMRDNDPPTVS